MKRFYSILLAALLLPALALAKVPDEEDILRKIIDRSSPYFYTNLIMRKGKLRRDIFPAVYRILHNTDRPSFAHFDSENIPSKMALPDYSFFR